MVGRSRRCFDLLFHKWTLLKWKISLWMVFGIAVLSVAIAWLMFSSIYVYQFSDQTKVLIPIVKNYTAQGTYNIIYRLRAKKVLLTTPLGNFADISYLEEIFNPHLLRDVCTLCSGALVSDSLLHMLL